MAREITTAWVYAPTKDSVSMETKFDEVRSFCKENNLGIWDSQNKVVIPAEDYDLKPVRRVLRTYGFYGPGSYMTSPEITLVPFGTTAEYGMFVFPKKS